MSENQFFGSVTGRLCEVTKNEGITLVFHLCFRMLMKWQAVPNHEPSQFATYILWNLLTSCTKQWFANIYLHVPWGCHTQSGQPHSNTIPTMTTFWHNTNDLTNNNWGVSEKSSREVLPLSHGQGDVIIYPHAHPFNSPNQTTRMKQTTTYKCINCPSYECQPSLLFQDHKLRRFQVSLVKTNFNIL